jgi:hypothetical protein
MPQRTSIVAMISNSACRRPEIAMSRATDLEPSAISVQSSSRPYARKKLASQQQHEVNHLAVDPCWDRESGKSRIGEVGPIMSLLRNNCVRMSFFGLGLRVDLTRGCCTGAPVYLAQHFLRSGWIVAYSDATLSFISARLDVLRFRRTLGISRSENGSVLGQVLDRGEGSPVSVVSKRHQFCGEIWEFIPIRYRY